MKKVTVGVVGLGRAGWNIHVRALRDNANFQIVEVADPTAERRQEAETELGCRAFESIDQMLEQGSAELIVVATPNPFHESDALKVLASGKHCVLEKPIAMTYSGAKSVVDLAREKNLHLFVHHQHLFAPEYNFIREVMESGVLGEVFEIRFNWVGYSRRNDWQTLKKNGGGHLNNHGPHALTSMLALLNAPVSALLATSQHIKDAGDAEDHAHLFLQTANGRTGDIFLSTACALPQPKFTVLGSFGTMVSDTGETAKLRFYDPAQAAPLEVIDGPAAGRKYGSGDQLPWQEEERPVQPIADPGTFYGNVSAVMAGSAEIRVTPESALEVTRAIQWAYEGKDPA